MTRTLPFIGFAAYMFFQTLTADAQWDDTGWRSVVEKANRDIRRANQRTVQARNDIRQMQKSVDSMRRRVADDRNWITRETLLKLTPVRGRSQIVTLSGGT